MECRHCGSVLKNTFLDLGFAPPSNAYLDIDKLSSREVYYPLKVNVCEDCWLVQTEDYNEADELFTEEYAYFSSTSKSFVEHAKNYSQEIITRFNLSAQSFVMELASNDGYLLRNFVESGIPCLGVEPTTSTAEAARKLDIEVIEEFFGEATANKIINSYQQADLIIGNNVYAHVPDINDFTLGMKVCLKDNGVITLEFPHLMNLIKYNQFDTIYHEHFSYLSLHSVNAIFKSSGLKIFDVDKLNTHGGSLRVYGCHVEDSRSVNESVTNLLLEETGSRLNTIETYKNFQSRAESAKDSFLEFLLMQKKNGKKVIAYGAAAKGNTLLNFAGIKTDLIQYVVDAAEAKQNKFMPGSHIPIVSPENLNSIKFDYIVILPWNLSDEIYSLLKDRVKNGTQFVTAIPELKIFS